VLIKQFVFETFFQKTAAGCSGVAGISCCQSLHRSEMSKHL
jgi:hypothetical protein